MTRLLSILVCSAMLGGCVKDDVQPVKIIMVHTAVDSAAEPWNCRMYPYTVVQSENGRRYLVLGEFGNVGDSLSMNVNNLTPVEGR